MTFDIDFAKVLHPDGCKWVELAGRADLGEAIEIAKAYACHQVEILNSENGWFAVVLGPIEPIHGRIQKWFGCTLPRSRTRAMGALPALSRLGESSGR
ncbi:hypothetical protein [Neorhizobium sp. LjRoot104]|uniref:hypothetical protein n=1 Tax=Neorhizobium sp. LjRoot104 TaxID=3342254 RepID=UPI003ED08080